MIEGLVEGECVFKHQIHIRDHGDLRQGLPREHGGVMRHAPQLRRFPFGYNFPLRRAGALALRHSHVPPNSPAARPVVGRPPQLAAGLVKERRARVAPLFGRLAAF